MTLKQFKQLFESLDNERRLELFEFIEQTYFISKTELAERFDLKRASLNHHLDIMLKAGLIYEKRMNLDGRRQSFIFPAIKLRPERFLEPKKELIDLEELLEVWEKRVLNADSWQILREELNRSTIGTDVITAVESQLFPATGKKSSIINFCVICHAKDPHHACNVCKNLICQQHTHFIERDEEDAVSLCPNCVEKFFG
jgi:DNA-binding transcriptional ArsR family regulator